MDALLIDRRQAAKMLGVSSRHVINLEQEGLIPPTRRLGNRRLFSVSELQTWIEQGCPSIEAMHRGPGVRC